MRRETWPESCSGSHLNRMGLLRHHETLRDLSEVHAQSEAGIGRYQIDGFGTSDGEKQTFIDCDIGRLFMTAWSVGLPEMHRQVAGDAPIHRLFDRATTAISNAKQQHVHIQRTGGIRGCAAQADGC